MAPRSTTQTPTQTPDADADGAGSTNGLAIDVESMSDETLAAILAQVSEAAAKRERDQRLTVALVSVGETLAEITFDDVSAAALDHDAEAVCSGLTEIITTLNRVRMSVTQAAGIPVGRPVTPRPGNGSQRASRIRDEIANVFAEHPEADFSVAELAHELPPAPTGNPVSSGAVQVALLGSDGQGGMVGNGQAVITQDSPRRFKGVTPTAPITEK